MRKRGADDAAAPAETDALLEEFERAMAGEPKACNPVSLPWTPARMDELTALWKAGLPTAEIGRRMGISKNAIIGKAHRIGLTRRPSPIIRGKRRLRPPPRTPGHHVLR